LAASIAQMKGKKMPKLKTHQGASKRFGVSRRGKVQGRAAAKRHRLVSKSKRMKREGRATHILCESDARIILDDFLPYERKKRKKRTRYISKSKRTGKEAA
jgi:large subunit ribosomal protein L35